MHKYIFLFINCLNKFLYLVIFIIIIIYDNFNYYNHLFLLYLLQLVFPIKISSSYETIIWKNNI